MSEYQDIRLQLSDSDEPVEQVKPKKKYTLSEKAKSTRIENLRLGREKRNAQLQKLKQEVVIDESDYSETESEDEYIPVKKTSRSHASKPVKHAKTKPQKQPLSRKEMELQLKVQKLEGAVNDLMKQKKKKRITHKTVIVPNQQHGEANPKKEIAKQFVLSLFKK